MARRAETNTLKGFRRAGFLGQPPVCIVEYSLPDPADLTFMMTKSGHVIVISQLAIILVQTETKRFFILTKFPPLPLFFFSL